jgi:O-antigen/teichoic acid export membrane protein
MPFNTDSPSKDKARTNRNQMKGLLGSLLALFTGQGARQGYLAAVDQAVISISNFLATIILARNVDPTQLGVYGVGFVTLRLVRAFQDGLIVQPLNVFGAGMTQDEFKRYATVTSIFQAALAILSAMIVALTGWVLIELGNDTAGPTLYILWLPFLWWQFQEYLRRMLYTRGKVFSAMLTSVIGNVARIIIMVYLANRGQLTGISGLEAIAWGSFVALLPSLWLTRNYWTRQIAHVKEIWWRNWAFGRWLLASFLANWAVVEFYPILTAGLISFAAAGAYRALQNLVAPIHLLLRAIDTFLTPRAARLYENNGLRALTLPLRSIYLAISLPVLLVLVLALVFPEQLLGLIYGDTYLEYSNGVILMALFYALMFAYWPLQSIFKAAQLSRPIFVANFLAIVSMFTIGIWAILKWEVYGTIIGQGVNALVLTLVLWGYWIELTKRPTPPTAG